MFVGTQGQVDVLSMIAGFILARLNRFINEQ